VSVSVCEASRVQGLLWTEAETLILCGFWTRNPKSPQNQKP
jgi:hypothetical protein